jgi:hypothetical protein
MHATAMSVTVDPVPRATVALVLGSVRMMYYFQPLLGLFSVYCAGSVLILHQDRSFFDLGAGVACCFYNYKGQGTRTCTRSVLASNLGHIRSLPKLGILKTNRDAKMSATN